MFKIPLKVSKIIEHRNSEGRILEMVLTETTEDDRLQVRDVIIAFKIHENSDSNPLEGFDRKRFKLDDIWYLRFDESEGTP